MGSGLGNNAERPLTEHILLEYPERPICPHCSRPMRVKSRSKPRIIVDVPGNLEIQTTYYQCGNPFCPGRQAAYVQPENHYAPPDGDYTYAVIAVVCHLRWVRHLTYEEIIAEMVRAHGIRLCLNTVENFLKVYEFGCASKYRPVFIEKVRANGGVILTIDGMLPLKGKQGLYTARDYLTGLALGSSKISKQDEDAIAAFLGDVKKRVEEELGVQVIAIVSDALPAQRLAIERVFPGVPHCLCHYHFYNLVLQGPKALDSSLTTAVRSALRKLYDLQAYRKRKAAAGAGAPVAGDFVTQVLELLLELSNWNRRPNDPVFTGTELVQRTRDVHGLLDAAVTKLDAGTITILTEKVVRRLHARLGEIIEEHATDASELGRIHEYIEEIATVLDDLESSKEEGLGRLKVLRDRLRKYRLSPRCGETERGFIEALMKFVQSKGEHLFNYKVVSGAPTTNNDHELSYKQLKHFLRRVIGHSAANAYLLAHGERIVYVNPSESLEDITNILQATDSNGARKCIAAERKGRDSLMFVIHNPLKWEQKINEIAQLIEIMEVPMIIIS